MPGLDAEKRRTSRDSEFGADLAQKLGQKKGVALLQPLETYGAERQN